MAKTIRERLTSWIPQRLRNGALFYDFVGKPREQLEVIDSEIERQQAEILKRRLELQALEAQALRQSTHQIHEMLQVQPGTLPSPATIPGETKLDSEIKATVKTLESLLDTAKLSDDDYKKYFAAQTAVKRMPGAAFVAAETAIAGATIIATIKEAASGDVKQAAENLAIGASVGVGMAFLRKMQYWYEGIKGFFSRLSHKVEDVVDDVKSSVGDETPRHKFKAELDAAQFPLWDSELPALVPTNQHEHTFLKEFLKQSFSSESMRKQVEADGKKSVAKVVPWLELENYFAKSYIELLGGGVKALRDAQQGELADTVEKHAEKMQQIAGHLQVLRPQSSSPQTQVAISKLKAEFILTNLALYSTLDQRGVAAQVRAINPQLMNAIDDMLNVGDYRVQYTRYHAEFDVTRDRLAALRTKVSRGEYDAILGAGAKDDKKAERDAIIASIEFLEHMADSVCESSDFPLAHGLSPDALPALESTGKRLLRMLVGDTYVDSGEYRRQFDEIQTKMTRELSYGERIYENLPHAVQLTPENLYAHVKDIIEHYNQEKLYPRKHASSAARLLEALEAIKSQTGVDEAIRINKMLTILDAYKDNLVVQNSSTLAGYLAPVIHKYQHFMGYGLSSLSETQSDAVVNQWQTYVKEQGLFKRAWRWLTGKPSTAAMPKQLRIKTDLHPGLTEQMQQDIKKSTSFSTAPSDAVQREVHVANMVRAANALQGANERLKVLTTLGVGADYKRAVLAEKLTQTDALMRRVRDAADKMHTTVREDLFGVDTKHQHDIEDAQSLLQEIKKQADIARPGMQQVMQAKQGLDMLQAMDDKLDVALIEYLQVTNEQAAFAKLTKILVLVNEQMKLIDTQMRATQVPGLAAQLKLKKDSLNNYLVNTIAPISEKLDRAGEEVTYKAQPDFVKLSAGKPQPSAELEKAVDAHREAIYKQAPDVAHLYEACELVRPYLAESKWHTSFTSMLTSRDTIAAFVQALDAGFDTPKHSAAITQAYDQLHQELTQATDVQARAQHAVQDFQVMNHALESLDQDVARCLLFAGADTDKLVELSKSILQAKTALQQLKPSKVLTMQTADVDQHIKELRIHLNAVSQHVADLKNSCPNLLTTVVVPMSDLKDLLDSTELKPLQVDTTPMVKCTAVLPSVCDVDSQAEQQFSQGSTRKMVK